MENKKFFEHDKSEIHVLLHKLHNMEEELTKDEKLAQVIDSNLRTINGKLMAADLNEDEVAALEEKIKRAEEHAERNLLIAHHNLREAAEAAQVMGQEV